MSKSPNMTMRPHASTTMGRVATVLTLLMTMLLFDVQRSAAAAAAASSSGSQQLQRRTTADDGLLQSRYDQQQKFLLKPGNQASIDERRLPAASGYYNNLIRQTDNDGDYDDNVNEDGDEAELGYDGNGDGLDDVDAVAKRYMRFGRRVSSLQQQPHPAALTSPSSSFAAVKRYMRFGRAPRRSAAEASAAGPLRQRLNLGDRRWNVVGQQQQQDEDDIETSKRYMRFGRR